MLQTWRQEPLVHPLHSGSLAVSARIAAVSNPWHISQMRTLILIVLTAACASCGASANPEQVDSIELRSTGLRVSVEAGGTGRFVRGSPVEGQRPTSFEIGPTGFRRLLAQLAPFRSYAGPTAAASQLYLSSGCPKDVPYVTEAGMISVRWIGSDSDQIYIADLGCDYKRRATENQRLRAILQNLTPSRA